MKFTQADLVQATNLITALKKAKFELEGLEVLAFAEVMKWFGGLHKSIKDQVENPKPVMTVVAPPVPIVEEVKAEPKPEEKPEKKTRKTK